MLEIKTDFNPVPAFLDAGLRLRVASFVPDKKLLLVTTPGFSKRGQAEEIVRALSGRECHVFDRVGANPDVEGVLEVARQWRDKNIQALIVLGGGSSLDTAKILAFLLTASNPNPSVAELQKVVEETAQPLPIYAFPTTAGTGAEVTPFSTMWDKKNHKKLSFTSPGMFPKSAFLDPDLLMSLPGSVSLFAGLDALTQCFESLWNRNFQEPYYPYARDGIAILLKHLPDLQVHLRSADSRALMMQASLFSGYCISRTRTAICHSISYPLTAHFEVPHGLACGFTLPVVLEFNMKESANWKVETLARDLGFPNGKALAEHVKDLYRSLSLGSRLQKYVGDGENVLRLQGEMLTPGRADNNIRTVTVNDVDSILRASLGDLGL